MGLRYRRQEASEAQIAAHLTECSPNFMPPLDEKVNIPEYAAKIFRHAATFEAWEEGALVGLVAMYCNDPERRSAFVTSVSTVSEHVGKGIASSLMKMAVDHAGREGFREISLEVAKANAAAIHIYEKLGFVRAEDREITTVMTRNLGTGEQ